MSRHKINKAELKRGQLLARTASALQIDESLARELLSLPRNQSLRLNPLSQMDDTLDALQHLGWQGERFDWCDDAYTMTAGLEAVRNSNLVVDGRVYIQNAASWLPVLALDPQVGEDILDICAAPGGKTSHIAAVTNNQAHITANDNSRPRLAKTRANLARMNVQNVEYTLYDATHLARKLDGRLFDKILLDAPCSGEGMMRFDNDKDFESWSVAHIKRLQQLQRRVITQAWQLLKPGGTLVYSTCTMAPEENEAVIDYLLRKNPDSTPVAFDLVLPNRVAPVLMWNQKQYDPRIASALRLVPSEHIEAFFVCKLTKMLHDGSKMI